MILYVYHLLAHKSSERQCLVMQISSSLVTEQRNLRKIETTESLMLRHLKLVGVENILTNLVLVIIYY